MDKFAVIKIGPKQYKVIEGEILRIERIEGKIGQTIFFDILLLSKNGNIKIGRPILKDVKVEAKIIGEEKGPKIQFVRYKPKSHFKKKRGARQIFSVVKIGEL